MKILGLLMTVPFVWIVTSFLIGIVLGVDLDDGDEEEFMAILQMGGVVTLFIYGLIFILWT